MVVAGILAMWTYVIVLSLGGRADPVDRLEDRAFPLAAEPICASAQSFIAELPEASTLNEPAERAPLLDAGTDRLDEMVAELRTLTRPDGDEGGAVAAWLDDWDLYLGNRRAYAERFRAGLDEPFRVADRGGQQVTELIDEFAKANLMPSCQVPLDV